MSIHLSVANTDITMQDLTVWGHFLAYRKWRNREVEYYGDTNMKGRNEAYYCKSQTEVKNKVFVGNVLITGQE